MNGVECNAIAKLTDELFFLRLSREPHCRKNY